MSVELVSILKPGTKAIRDIWEMECLKGDVEMGLSRYGQQKSLKIRVHSWIINRGKKACGARGEENKNKKHEQNKILISRKTNGPNQQVCAQKSKQIVGKEGLSGEVF